VDHPTTYLSLANPYRFLGTPNGLTIPTLLPAERRIPQTLGVNAAQLAVSAFWLVNWSD
jgi:hypothetical protein